MNNELSDNYYFGVLNDDGSYTRISKIADEIAISHQFKLPNKKNAKKKYRKFYALLKQKELYMRRMFVAEVSLEFQTRVAKALENAILYGANYDNSRKNHNDV